VASNPPFSLCWKAIGRPTGRTRDLIEMVGFERSQRQLLPMNSVAVSARDGNATSRTADQGSAHELAFGLHSLRQAARKPIADPGRGTRRRIVVASRATARTRIPARRLAGSRLGSLASGAPLGATPYGSGNPSAASHPPGTLLGFVLADNAESPMNTQRSG
jgi:hypothetical protein